MRVVAFAVVFILGMFGPWWVCVLCGALYALWFPVAYELVMLGALLDSLFGIHTAYTPFPLYYTLALALVCASMSAVRPYIRISS